MDSMLSTGLANESMASGLSAGLADASMAMKPLAQLAEEFMASGPWCCGEVLPHDTRRHSCTSVRVVG